ncbi:MAG TPA: DUF5667 domain-containing protein [Anaerolineales bacterium]|nr:DUF5667 domain-containing protein [Anaerolineales bacterium]
MNNLHEALEICLQDIEQGADIETVLFRYPDLADQLRPILEASMNARRMAVPGPSAEVVRRNRARVLQQAAQMREAKLRSSQRSWYVSLRRTAVTLVVVVALFVSGTGLVRAASTTLPGDNLYPVKRTWEDMLLVFTFNLQQRDALEVEHENERINEVHELFAKGRSTKVDFAGVVKSQNGTKWLVSEVQVVISPQTILTDQAIAVGSAVHVVGQTQSDKTVLADRVELLPAGAPVPEENNQPEFEKENTPEPNEQNESNSEKESENETPMAAETRVAVSTPESNDSTVSSDSTESKDSSQNSSEDNHHETSTDSGGDHSSSEGSGGDH